MPRAAERVRHLEAVAILLDQRDALSVNSVAGVVMSGAFDPVAMQLRPFALAASWQFQVEDTLTANDYEVLGVKTALTTLGQDRFGRLAALAGPAANLRHFLSQAALDANTTWDEAKRRIAARSTGVASLVAAVRAIGLSDRVSLARLEELGDLVGRWIGGTARLTAPHSIALIGDPLLPVSIIHDSANFAITVHRCLPAAAAGILADGWHSGVAAARGAAAAFGAEQSIFDVTLRQLSQVGFDRFAARVLDQSITETIDETAILLAARSDLPHFLRFATARDGCSGNALSEAMPARTKGAWRLWNILLTH